MRAGDRLPRITRASWGLVKATRLVVIVVAVAAAGCATASPVPPRASTEEESKLLREALTPLLAELRDPTVHGRGCTVNLGIVPVPRINAGVARVAGPCPTFSLLITEGALRRLPVPMLRAVLAHELGHLALGHTPGKTTRDDEGEADRFAVELLKRIEPRHPDACVQLVYVLASLPEQGGLAAAWLASHPSPDRRAESVLAGCNRRPR